MSESEAKAAAGDITVILQAWDNDRESAVNALTPIVYSELRRIGAAYLRRERPDHTLQPTALINEAYLRLVKQDLAGIRDRSHFFALAARMMRRILVDAARVSQAEKRGSGQKVQLDEKLEIGENRQLFDLLAIHEALEKLNVYSKRTAQAVELRYFGGLQLAEIAEALCIGLSTAKRDLVLGEAWLRRALAVG